MNRLDVSNLTIAHARDVGKRQAATEFRAQSVNYLPARDAIEVITIGGAGFVIPRQFISALNNATQDDLHQLEMWPDGSIIEIDHLDLHIAVDGMIKAALPAMVPQQVLASMFAARGGAAKSSVKAQSSRENGKKGGRPSGKQAA